MPSKTRHIATSIRQCDGWGCAPFAGDYFALGRKARPPRCVDLGTHGARNDGPQGVVHNIGAYGIANVGSPLHVDVDGELLHIIALEGDAIAHGSTCLLHSSRAAFADNAISTHSHDGV